MGHRAPGQTDSLCPDQESAAKRKGSYHLQKNGAIRLVILTAWMWKPAQWWRFCSNSFMSSTFRSRPPSIIFGGSSITLGSLKSSMLLSMTLGSLMDS